MNKKIRINKTRVALLLFLGVKGALIKRKEGKKWERSRREGGRGLRWFRTKTENKFTAIGVLSRWSKLQIHVIIERSCVHGLVNA